MKKQSMDRLLDPSCFQFMVTVYNPLGRPGQWYVRLPVSSEGTAHFQVTGPSGQAVTSEVMHHVVCLVCLLEM